MPLQEAIRLREEALIKSLAAKCAAINDQTGKGIETEQVIERELLIPHLPPEFKCQKGAVVRSADPATQSPPIDRVIYDPGAAPPLLYGEAHSIFPIESVAGLVEITMHLDATKLREDLLRMAPVKAMTKRRYAAPVPNTTTRVVRLEQETLSPRSFVIGLPSDQSWKPETIAHALRRIQQDLGAPTHVHGLYVIGIGYFETVPIESSDEPMYRIKGWVGPDRLFRFTNGLRHAFQRWGRLPPGWSVDLQDYVQGDSRILAE